MPTYPNCDRPEIQALVPNGVKRVLDVGCHTGYFGAAINMRFGAEVWGVEPNQKTAIVARERLFRVHNADFSDELDLPDRYFDLITFNDVLEHIPDPWASLKIAASKLTSDGFVLVSVPNFRHIDNLLHILKDRDFNYEELGIRDRTHLRFFTRKSAPKLFDGTGLIMTQLTGINENWWTRSIGRRVAYKLFPEYLDDTKHIQFVMLAKLVLPRLA